MSKAMVFPAILMLACSLWAADPFVGTWELNVAKSEFPSALLEALGIAKPEQETIVIRELNGDELEILVTGTHMDGSQTTRNPID